MRRFEILQDWDGWRRTEMLFGLCLTLFGVLVALFPKLLVFMFAALCIGAGVTLMYAAFRDRLSVRALKDMSASDIYGGW